MPTGIQTQPSHHTALRGIKTLALLLVCFTGLTACLPASTPTKNTRNVGPTPTAGVVPQAQKFERQKDYTYDSNTFLDVVIPVFDPGLPKDRNGELDYKKIEKQGLWPQLRRAEANRFAVDTRDAIAKIGSFGAVSVVPGSNASGDVYVLGTINESNSEKVGISIAVLDSQGQLWGEKQFTHTVSTGFYRDQTNAGKDSYQPVFNQIGDYVYELLIRRSENEKQTIKQVTDIRYAQSYAPGALNQYIKRTQNDDGLYQYQLIGTPPSQGATLKRIAPLRVQDQLFVDRMQSHYDSFYTRTNDGYRSWQKETLPEVVALRKTRADRNVKIGLGALLATAAILLDKNSNSTAGGLGSFAGIVASGVLLNSALDKSAELKVHKQTLDEMGESLDIQVSPQLLKHNEQTVELTGTANEQYEQWKAHLKKIYELENAQ